MRCPSCGNENDEGSVTCKSCGAKLTPETEVKTERVEEEPSFSKGDIIGAKYEVIEKLGSGQLGILYRVRHIKLKEEVALKVIRPKMLRHELDLKKFTEIFQDMKRLDHPGIVKYYDVGEEKDTKFYTRELVDGISLRKYMDRFKKEGKPFPIKDALIITKKILEILSYAHQFTIHRDLTPENIILQSPVSYPYNIKLTDWGITKLGDSTILAESRTTPSPYSAPELHGFRGLHEEPPPSCDLYSTAAILYEMIIGSPLSGPFIYPTKVREDATEKIDDLIELGLSPDKDEEGNPLRFQSAEVMLANVNQAIEELPFGRFKLPVSKWIFVTIGIIAIAIIGSWFYLSSKLQPDPKRELEEIMKHRTSIRTMILERARSKESKDVTPDQSALNEGMVYIPAGEYINGYFEGETQHSPNESFEKVVEVDGFYIDINEYQRPGEETPFTKVTWFEAKRICEDNGKRLCTADEWEKACKGPANLIYPYGDYFVKDVCPQPFKEKSYTLNEFPECKSGYGVLNMGGGVWEWTSTPHPYSSNRKLVKGGEKGNMKMGTRCAYVKDESAFFSDANLGFRCCKDKE